MSINPLCISPYIASPLAVRVPKPFHIHAKRIWKKENEFVLSKVWIHNPAITKSNVQPNQPIHICDNSYHFRILLSRQAFKYIIKIMHKLKYTQLAHIGLEPKSSHTIKYSQPIELVLFHVITLCIKGLKGFFYPHLLNNYLVNYLIFSGLTPFSVIS